MNAAFCALTHIKPQPHRWQPLQTHGPGGWRSSHPACTRAGRCTRVLPLGRRHTALLGSGCRGGSGQHSTTPLASSLLRRRGWEDAAWTRPGRREGALDAVWGRIMQRRDRVTAARSQRRPVECLPRLLASDSSRALTFEVLTAAQARIRTAGTGVEWHLSSTRPPASPRLGCHGLADGHLRRRGTAEAPLVQGALARCQLGSRGVEPLSRRRIHLRRCPGSPGRDRKGERGRTRSCTATLSQRAPVVLLCEPAAWRQGAAISAVRAQRGLPTGLLRTICSGRLFARAAAAGGRPRAPAGEQLQQCPLIRQIQLSAAHALLACSSRASAPCAG